MIDVSEIVTDPDFLEEVTLIRRAAMVDNFGDNTITETETTVEMVVLAGSGETLKRLPDGVRLTDAINIFYAEHLNAQTPGGYPDVIVRGGRRYQVQNVFDYGTSGYWEADCLLDGVSA